MTSSFLFCFTLDTEPDNLWANLPENRFEHASLLPEFHNRISSLGARATYLTTSEFAEDAEARKSLQSILDKGDAELGAHFHSWTREWPFEVPDLGSPPVHACAHNLGQKIEEQMLEFTCRRLRHFFGIRAISFRGGRWSFNGSSVTSLNNCGIKIDSSFTPGISWKNMRHPLLDGPDYRYSQNSPFYMKCGSISPLEHGDVLEIPVGTAFSPNRSMALSRNTFARIARKFRSKVLRKPTGVLWLRPTTQSREEMRECMKILKKNDIRIWVAMIHSSEIIKCKYFPNDIAVKQFWTRCENLIQDAGELGAGFGTLKEAGEFHEKTA